MDAVTRDMVINDVIRKHPATIKVFNEHRVDSCCGGGASIETTAKRDGIAVEPLVDALNAAVRAAEGEQK
jgi:iron-sulfur cluster repair protein YtfE (RIC family)